MTRLLDIGVSGLSAHQRALATTGHNITNANVEGYSRQETLFDTALPQLRNGLFTGSGVSIESIRRITDEFIVSQSFIDTSRVGELEALDTGLRRLDQLLSSEETGLSNALSELFSSVQAVTESPSSLVLREQVLNDAERYITRYNSIVDQIEQIAGQVESAITSQVGQINNLAGGIAELNRQISTGSHANGAQPNDLLDQRDQQLRELAEYINFTTSTDGNGGVNVFIGGGQALVLGSEARSLTTLSTGGSGNQLEIAINKGGSQQIITDRVRGGQVGGLLQLRDSGLDSALNQLGMLQTQLSYAFNSLHRQGVDLNGNNGSDFFTSVNDHSIALSRVTASASNTSTDALISVTLDDPALLTTSDYSLRFSDSGGLLGYQLVRDDDGTVVSQGSLPQSFPQTIEISDGFSIHLESGSFQAGDQYTLRPTRVEAGSADVLLVNPESLALALPVSTSSAAGNLGQGIIEQVDGLSSNTLSFADYAQLEALREASPPLVIRFTSETTYDILENSNPTQPVDLVPPLTNLTFLPNQSNQVLDVDPLSSLYETSGAFAFTAVPGAISTTNNGYSGETVTFTLRDADAGAVTTQNIVALAGESAATVAARLSAVEGVKATANTELSLTVADDGLSTPLELRLNGIELTSTASGPVPSPVDSDFLATRINTLFAGAGIVAQSDGSSLTVRSLTGEDLTFENISAGTDNIAVEAINGSTLPSPIQLNASVELIVAGTVTVTTGSNIALSSSGGFLDGSSAQTLPAFVGYDVAISGQPQAGDEFYVSTGTTGAGDNRNALALASLLTADMLSNGSSLSDIYAGLVADVGGKAGAVAIDKEAADSILTQTQARLAEVSGVNLDEEAAKLLQYEQAYNASAQVISIARSLFDSLLGAFI